MKKKEAIKKLSEEELDKQIFEDTGTLKDKLHGIIKKNKEFSWPMPTDDKLLKEIAEYVNPRLIDLCYKPSTAQLAVVAASYL